MANDTAPNTVLEFLNTLFSIADRWGLEVWEICWGGLHCIYITCTHMRAKTLAHAAHMHMHAHARTRARTHARACARRLVDHHEVMKVEVAGDWCVVL